MAMPVAEPGITKAADLAWIDLPPGMDGGAPISGSKHGYVGTLTLQPGNAFPFHRHPGQDETIYVLEGTMEGWYEQQRAQLHPGDVILAPAGAVHACYNTSDQSVRLLVVLTPLLPGTDEDWEMVDGYGWEMVDVSDQEPWSTLR